MGLRLDGVVVLVVEDNPDVLQLTDLILRSYGATVMTADCAAAALRIVEKSPPHVLLSDIGLPGMDGYTLLKKIQELERQKHLADIPAAAVTAFSGAEDLQRALSAGYRFRLSKPFDIDQLITTVASLAGRAGNLT